MKFHSTNALFRKLTLLTCILGLALWSIQIYAIEPVKIGILAFRPKPQTQEQWQPLAIALKQAMPERDFLVEAFTYPELGVAVASHQLDFVLTNPAHYILLAKRSGLSTPLATLNMNENSKSLTMFGGVIFTRVERNDIKTLSDIKNKIIAATNTDSLGGFQMQAYELNQANINLQQDDKIVITGMPHDNVVNAVLNMRADVGFVRTGVIESMVREGKLDIKKIKIINHQTLVSFPVQTSTRLYPEWPFVAMPDTDKKLASHVAAALFVLEDNITATRAMNIHGFGVPADYTPVTNLLKTLKVAPFDEAPIFTLWDVWGKYRYQLAFILAVLSLNTLLVIRLIFTKRKLDTEYQVTLKQREQLQKSELQLRTILDSTSECVKLVSSDGSLLSMNPAGLVMIEAESPDLVLNQSVYSIVAPEHRAAFQAFNEDICSGKSGSLEFKIIGLKGAHRWMDTRAVPFKVELTDEVNQLAFTQEITSRKKLEIQKEQYYKFFQLSIDPMCITDHLGRFKQVNSAFENLLGLRESEMLERYLIDFVPPEDLQKTKHELTDNVKIRPSLNFENNYICKDGEIKLLSWTAYFDDKENVTYATAHDITESKLAEQALRDSEESLRESQIIAGIGNYVLNIQTGSWESSNILDQILGIDEKYERSEKGWDALIHPEDLPKAKNYLRRRFAAKCTTYDREYRIIRHSDNVERYLRGMGRLILDNQGRPLQMHGTIQDITDIRQELLAEKRAILGNQLIGIITVINRKVIWANSAFETMLGYGPGELTGVPTREFYANEEGYQAVRAYYPVIENNEIAHTQQEFVCKDGRKIWVEMSATQLHREAKESLWAFVDITERKQTENDLRIAATAFESQEGMLVSDANNVIIRVNNAFTFITGFAAEEVIGKNPRMLSSGRQDAAFYSSMWKNINDTGAWSGEIWNRRKNGTEFPEYLTITAVKGVDGIITNYVATLTDITERKQAEDKIQHLAFYDPLTHLPNRRLLLDRLNQALVFSTRTGRDGAILFLDLDHFKTLNDSLGHDIGDLLLQQVAERLTQTVREGDTVARLGGDEFVIMLEDLSESVLEAAAQAEAISEKILTALNQPFQLAAHEYHNTPSIGIALFSGHEQSQEELLKHADIAMYQAKKAGRNMIRFFDPKMQQTIHARVDLERELRKALDHKQFHLYYQVQVDISERPLGAEALIRWLHPERGLISPFHFIPLAEETGLILPIGLWVLETACAQLKRWEQDLITRELTISINVSAKQFYQIDFVAQVQAAVQSYAIDPTKLKLELTESMLLDNIEDTIVKMNSLKEIGISFSLDDFGTGYSSLQYLKRLPLAQLKIDQSFVRDIAVDISDQEIVHTIIAMAQALNLNVIAEGVETNEQLGLLLNNGCMHYQGYLFGKPVPIDEFEAALRKSDFQ